MIIIGMALNVTASSFLWPLNAIYIHDNLGKSLTAAGLVLMANSFASVIGNLAGGILFDKIGGYKAVASGVGIMFFAAAGMVYNHTWVPYILFLGLSGFGSGITFPAIFAMAGSVWKEGGRRAFNAVYVAQNAGVAAGSALGGLIVYYYSFDYVFIANGALYFLFLLLVLFGFKRIEASQAVQTNIIAESGSRISRKSATVLALLCFGYFLCWMGYVQWQSTISAYTQEIGISLREYSLLWTVNGALIVIAQPLFSAAVKFFKSLMSQLIFGMIFFIAAFTCAAFAGSLAGFMTAMVILTIGEMFVWPAVPAAASQLSPPGKEGFFQGIVNSTATAGRMIGPVLGGLLVDWQGMGMMFSVFIVLVLCAIASTVLYGKSAAKNSAAGQDPSIAQ